MDELIDHFLHRMAVEKGASEHTLRAYATDLRQFAEFLAGRGRALSDADVRDVRGFLATLQIKGLARSTVARRTAAVRSFYKFLVRDGVQKTNPTSALRSPRRERKLPGFLTVSEVEQLLEAPDASGWTGLRDRAILETLYGGGLRVSELVGLDHEDVDLSSGLLRVRGKGKKERIVPAGRCAVAAIREYLSAAEAHAPRGRDAYAVFVNARDGAPPDGPQRPPRHAEVPLPDRPEPGPQPPRPAPQLRHPHAQQRRRPARRPGAVRPQEPEHHPDLHPPLPRAPEEDLRSRASAGVTDGVPTTTTQRGTTNGMNGRPLDCGALRTTN